MALTDVVGTEAEDAACPAGWTRGRLSELCDVITDGTHYTPHYVTRGIPFYSVENVTANEFRRVKQISAEEHRRLSKRCRPRRGDILMTRIGSLADTKLIDWDVDASIYVSLALLRPGRQVDPGFLYAYTKSRQFVKDVEDRALLWAIPKKINMGDIGLVPVAYPVRRDEQAAIGDVVHDAAQRVGALERLIAKKRAIRQGMMQQLLTGDTRLTGFTEPWVEVRLGEIARIKTGSRNNQDKESLGRYPFFVRSATVERINSYSYDCEAILVPGEGGIGSIFHYVRGKFEVHQRVYKISDFNSRSSGRFVYYYMCQFFGPHAMENSVKATVDSLRLPTFNGFELHLPRHIEEQTAIAGVLDDIENEIGALDGSLHKAQAIKRGMMQQLLTGRTRLAVAEVAA